MKKYQIIYADPPWAYSSSQHNGVGGMGADLTNKAESVMDLLVDCGIIVDDSWQVVEKLTLRIGGIDKKNPRVVVEILTP